MQLSRSEIDAVARAVVSGRRSGNRRLDELANRLADQMKGRLEAVGAPGRNRVRRRPSKSVPVDRELFSVLERRVAKHLAARAVADEGASAV